jgi:DNA-binding phage protein
LAKVKIAPFDASEYLDDEEVIAEYLTAALEDPNPEVFLIAVAECRQGTGNCQGRPGFRTRSRESVQGARAWR